MFHPTTVDAATPRAVRTFISQVMDVYLADIHAMLRLPRPEVNIGEGCNFSIVAVLMNVISGVSVVLYEPPANRQATGRKFMETANGFCPWDTEPVGAINPPDLVVLDLGLPSVSGHVVRQAIAGDPMTRHIPVVVVTGATGDLESLDVPCVLRKPVSPDRLIDPVRAALRQEPGRTAPDTTEGAR